LSGFRPDREKSGTPPDLAHRLEGPSTSSKSRGNYVDGGRRWIAAGPDAAEQLLMACPGEGDDDPGRTRKFVDDVIEPVQAGQASVCAAGGLSVVDVRRPPGRWSRVHTPGAARAVSVSWSADNARSRPPRCVWRRGTIWWGVAATESAHHAVEGKAGGGSDQREGDGVVDGHQFRQPEDRPREQEAGNCRPGSVGEPRWPMSSNRRHL